MSGVGGTADERVSWDAWFMGMAEYVAGRGTCDRRQVGAVLVRGRRLVATGYNGAPEGVPHCGEAGHDLDGELHCTRAVHAEHNVLLQCARYGVPTEGATLYSTVLPCWKCYGALHQAHVHAVYYVGDYWPGDAAVGRRLLALQGAPHAPALRRLELPAPPSPEAMADALAVGGAHPAALREAFIAGVRAQRRTALPGAVVRGIEAMRARAYAVGRTEAGTPDMVDRAATRVGALDDVLRLVGSDPGPAGVGPWELMLGARARAETWLAQTDRAEPYKADEVHPLARDVLTLLKLLGAG